MDALSLISVIQHIFIFAIINGCWVLALLIRSGQKNPANYALVVWLGLLLVELSWRTTETTDFMRSNPEWIGAFVSFDSFYGPLFLLYVVMQLGRYKAHWSHSLFFFPFAISALFGWSLFTQDPSQKLEYFNSVSSGKMNWTFGVYDVFYYSAPLVSYLLAYRHLTNSQDNNKKTWLIYFAKLQILAWFITVFLCQLAVYISPAALSPVLLLASYLPHAIILYVVSFYGLLHANNTVSVPAITEEEKVKTETLEPQIMPEKYQKHKLKDSIAEQLKEKLQSHMETARPHFDNELTLAELAKQLETSTHHLSQLLNLHFQQSFSEFINDYRVEAVKFEFSKLSQDKKNILELALSCGFNSKGTFNNAFKRKEKMTPSEFRKRRRQSSYN